MAAKEEIFTSKKKQQLFENSGSASHENLNLNQADFFVDHKHEERKNVQLWKNSKNDLGLNTSKSLTCNKTTENKNQKRWKNDKNGTPSSTLSLHIAAYENSIDASSNGINDLSNKIQTLKIDTKSKTKFEAPFEFPRNKDDTNSTAPEIQQFTSTQRLMSPNQGVQRFSSMSSPNPQKRDRRYCSEYEEIEAADVKEPCFQTHKMEEEMSSGGTSAITEKRPKDGRAAFAKLLMARSVFKLAKEYVDSRGYLPKNFSTDIYLQNEARNRYTDVLCNDRTRVILTNGSYVHANWVPIPNSMQRFICAQGPLEETAEDFWRMVLQEKCQVVIMLCDFYENNLEKCYQYFPPTPGDSIKIGQFTITNFMQCECDIESIKWSVLEVLVGKRKVLINSFRYHSWPDHLAPLNPGIVIDLMQLARSKSDVRPIVVHCSAGIGRTGTFVGLEYANERLKSGDKLGLVDIMKELRAHRLQSIQSHLQYLYLAVCLLEYFARQNLIERDTKFHAFLASYISYVKRHAAKHGILQMQKDK